jgi:putative transposase
MNAALNRQLRMGTSHTHHVFHRGQNYQTVFHSQIERDFFLGLCAKYAASTKCEIHSYCLMSNHFHILLTPSKCGGLSLMMKEVLGQFARWSNQLHMKSGSVWNGSFKSLAIDSNNYLLSCMKFIELIPCRADLVNQPREYEWSSYRTNAHGSYSSFVSPHPVYRELGENLDLRMLEYQRLFVNENV